MSVASEHAMSSQIDAYVGGGGSEWASGDTDPDDDFYVPKAGRKCHSGCRCARFCACTNKEPVE